jgi:glycosyltransferase involved in cell wall biosynthesis
MKILLINKFFYLKGGSERTFFDEAKLLEENGNQVVFFSMRDEKNLYSPHSEYFIDGVDYDIPSGIGGNIAKSFKLLYSFEAKKKLEALIIREKPDIAHLHNIHHQISPSIIHLLKKYNIPVVMTLHDCKMVCPAYTMTRNGQPCEECSQGRYFRCFIHRCTKGSYLKSMINVMEMYLHHRILRIYEGVDIFISPSQFLRDKLKGMGFNRKIITLPNPIDTRLYQPKYDSTARAFCYFGRLSPEKGILSLIEAMDGIDADLKIIGAGPLKSEILGRVKSEERTRIHLVGYKSGDELKAEVGDCLAVIVPSECYENYPYAILESFALGKPVVGSRIGGIPELVIDRETGFTFTPGDQADLRSRLKIILSDHDLVVKMGRQARKFVLENLKPEQHYQELMKIYQLAAGN